jgi:hypothetical protein
MAVVNEVCPLHADEWIEGRFVSDEVGHHFICTRKGHPGGGPYEWTRSPEPPGDTDGLSGLAEDLGLAFELPAVLKEFPDTWVEYGVIERAYALAHRGEWEMLVRKYGHTAQTHGASAQTGGAATARQYTVSAFLGGTLARLHRKGYLEYHSGPATGRWTYNGETSWYALPPGPDWKQRLSWEASGATVKDYVPDVTEA